MGVSILDTALECTCCNRRACTNNSVCVYRCSCVEVYVLMCMLWWMDIAWSQTMRYIFTAPPLTIAGCGPVYRCIREYVLRRCSWSKIDMGIDVVRGLPSYITKRGEGNGKCHSYWCYVRIEIHQESTSALCNVTFKSKPDLSKFIACKFVVDLCVCLSSSDDHQDLTSVLHLSARLLLPGREAGRAIVAVASDS